MTEAVTIRGAILREDPDNLGWGCRIGVPSHSVAGLVNGRGPNDRRVLCSVRGLSPWHAALMPDGSGDYFVIVNKERRRAAGLEVGNRVTIELRPDESKYGADIAPELEELFYQDPEGSDLFHALTPGLQRSIIYIVSKPKGSATRLRRAVVLIDYLKAVRGAFDFREYNEAYRNSP